MTNPHSVALHAFRQDKSGPKSKKVGNHCNTCMYVIKGLIGQYR